MPVGDLNWPSHPLYRSPSTVYRLPITDYRQPCPQNTAVSEACCRGGQAVVVVVLSGSSAARFSPPSRSSTATSWYNSGPGWLAASGAVLYLLGAAVRRSSGTACCGPWGRRWLAETLRAYYIGHLGKYVPGKAMVVILRTGF